MSQEFRQATMSLVEEAGIAASNGGAILLGLSGAYVSLLGTLTSAVTDRDATDAVFYTNLACLAVVLTLTCKALYFAAYLVVYPTMWSLRRQLKHEQTRMNGLAKSLDALSRNVQRLAGPK